MTQNDKVELKRAANALLEPLGFQRKGSRWIRQNEETSQEIELQKSAYSVKYWLRMSVFVNGINLKEVLNMPPHHTEPGHFDAELACEVQTWDYQEQQGALSIDELGIEKCLRNLEVIVSSSKALIEQSATIEGIHQLSKLPRHGVRVNGHIGRTLKW